jgi:hypothetical protein
MTTKILLYEYTALTGGLYELGGPYDTYVHPVDSIGGGADVRAVANSYGETETGVFTGGAGYIEIERSKFITPDAFGVTRLDQGFLDIRLEVEVGVSSTTDNFYNPFENATSITYPDWLDAVPTVEIRVYNGEENWLAVPTLETLSYRDWTLTHNVPSYGSDQLRYRYVSPEIRIDLHENHYSFAHDLLSVFFVVTGAYEPGLMVPGSPPDTRVPSPPSPLAPYNYANWNYIDVGATKVSYSLKIPTLRMRQRNDGLDNVPRINTARNGASSSQLSLRKGTKNTYL